MHWIICSQILSIHLNMSCRSFSKRLAIFSNIHTVTYLFAHQSLGHDNLLLSVLDNFHCNEWHETGVLFPISVSRFPAFIIYSTIPPTNEHLWINGVPNLHLVAVDWFPGWWITNQQSIINHYELLFYKPLLNRSLTIGVHQWVYNHQS